MRCRKAASYLAALAWAAAALAGAGPAQAQGAFQQGLEAYLNGEYRTALEHWQPAAESGDPVAAFNIGVLHAQGLGVPADPAEAVRWYRRSAQAGYANAQFNLGAAYYNGEGIEVNIAQAVSWWERAAEQNHPEALYNLATLYRRGEGVQQDARRAESLFSRAASLGDARARQALSDMGAGPPDGGDSGAARPGTPAQGEADAAAAPPDGARPLAEENPEHLTVQVFAGTEEQAARRFARDHELAGKLRIYQAEIDGRTWFKGIYGSFADRAAAGAAQDMLARELPGSDPWIRRFGAIQAEAVGETLVTDAAAGGAAPGPDSAPEPSAGGAGTAGAQAADDEPVDDAAGTATPGDSASGGGESSSSRPESGDQAAVRKGQQAFNAQDYAAALEAWRPLAEKGVAEAQYGVGFMYESGWGVEQDYGEAFRWYQRAAQQGHVKAQYNLGMLYRDGQGVSQNDALGLYWIQSAADRGDERAVEYLQDLD